MQGELETSSLSEHITARWLAVVLLCSDHYFSTKAEQLEGSKEKRGQGRSRRHGRGALGWSRAVSGGFGCFCNPRALHPEPNISTGTAQGRVTLS